MQSGGDCDLIPVQFPGAFYAYPLASRPYADRILFGWSASSPKDVVPARVADPSSCVETGL
jgi:hypothetical protein